MTGRIVPGVVVVCLDDTDVRPDICEGYVYSVAKTTHEGMMVYLDGVGGPFSADRFDPLYFPTIKPALRLVSSQKGTTINNRGTLNERNS